MISPLLRFPDESLLVVNSLQKEISSSHPITKAFALRTLSSVRLPTVMPILLISVRKCVGDPVPYVRQTAAFVLSQIEPGFKDPFQEDLEKVCVFHPKIPKISPRNLILIEFFSWLRDFWGIQVPWSQEWLPWLFPLSALKGLTFCTTISQNCVVNFQPWMTLEKCQLWKS